MRKSSTPLILLCTACVAWHGPSFAQSESGINDIPSWIRDQRQAVRTKETNPSGAIGLFEAAFKKAVSENAPAKDRLNIALELGELEFQQGELTAAFDSYKKGEDIAVSEKRQDWQAAFLAREGLTQSFQYLWGQIETPPEPQLVLKALELRPGDPKIPTDFRCICYHALEQMYLSIDDLKNAEKYINLALTEAEQLGNQRSLVYDLERDKAILATKSGKPGDGLKALQELINKDKTEASKIIKPFSIAVLATDQESAEIKEALSQLFKSKNFAGLDKKVDELRKNKNLLSDGDSLEGLLERALEPASTDSDAMWQEKLAAVKVWIKNSPESVNAKTLLADLLVSYAWKARGTADRIKHPVEFGERLGYASNALAAVPPALRPAMWYTVAARIARGGGHWSHQQFDQLVDGGLSKYPYFDPLRFEKLHWLLPRWHGKDGEAEAYLAEVLKTRSSQDADIFYARSIWHFEKLDSNLRTLKGFDYARMKRGLEAICANYPKAIKPKWELYYTALREGDSATAERVSKTMFN